MEVKTAVVDTCAEDVKLDSDLTSRVVGTGEDSGVLDVKIVDDTFEGSELIFDFDSRVD